MERLDHDPASSLARLRRTAEGCDALADAWDELGQALEEQGSWDGDQARRALRLLGQADPPTARDRNPAASLWRDYLACRPDPAPADLERGFGPAPAERPEPEQAR